MTVAAKTPNVEPLTVVDEYAETSFAELIQRIEKTRADHSELLQKYHEVWYNAPHTWHYTHFLGVGLMKCPNDLWIYQALMSDIRPNVVIETGTYSGGSALWFAFLMEMLGIKGKVYTVDYEDRRRCDHPRIMFLGGDSRDPAIRDAIVEDMGERTGHLLVSLDADHSADHVYRELNLYAPLCKVGDRLVVEDTNIGWLGEHGDRGARGGVEDYLKEHPGEWQQDILCERYLLTMNPGGWLVRVGECSHA